MTSWRERLLGETQTRLLEMLRRGPSTIAELAGALGLTDNAVRVHVSALMRDGLVEQSATQRETGGKPARVYLLTADGEEIFPKAYATVLLRLIDEIALTSSPDHAVELLRAVGRRVASGVVRPGEPAARVEAAAEVLRSLGGDIDVVALPDGWQLQGRGCPLSGVSGARPQTCELARAAIGEATGYAVSACCGQGPRPSCGFTVRIPA